MKNACPFYMVFYILKILLIKILKIQLPDLFIYCCFYCFYISRYHFSQFFRTSININWKKDFCQKLSNGFAQPPLAPHPLNDQNQLCVTKAFCRRSFNQKWDLQKKMKKANMHILHAFNAFNELCIFKLVSVPNFTLSSSEFWHQIFPKRIFLV